jgi:hypothetical protein
MEFWFPVNARSLEAVTGWSSPNLGGHRSHSAPGSPPAATSAHPRSINGSVVMLVLVVLLVLVCEAMPM